MSDTEVDKKRRRFLINTTCAIGAVGAGAMAVPMVASLTPSARALAAGAPVDVDISKIESGGMTKVIWRGKPVWVVNRTPEMLKDLPSLDNKMKDPDSSDAGQQPEYAKNVARSRKPEYLVMVGICTHLGCSPTFRPEVAPADLGSDWRGGFYCPCHGSLFDLAGRVTKNSPAANNMEVPPHYYISDNLIRVGLNDASEVS